MAIQIDSEISFAEMMKAQWRVLYAIMLRDVRTRFSGTGLGYIVYICWPLSHLLLIVVLYSVVHREVPYGSSMPLFVATGVAPYICFNYTSRFIVLAGIVNRPLLSLPVVKVLDILFARAILETLTSSLIVVILFVILTAGGIDCVPVDCVQAAYAMLAAIGLGIGLGIVNGVIALAVPFWATGYVLFIILAWVASGILFIPDNLPEPVRNALAINPVMQIIVWMRAAYYPSFGTSVLSKPYVLTWIFLSLALGLFLERLMRARLIQH